MYATSDSEASSESPRRKEINKHPRCAFNNNFHTMKNEIICSFYGKINRHVTACWKAKAYGRRKSAVKSTHK